MSRIKAKNTKPEILVRNYLFSKGFRYRLHDSSLPGKPDLVFPKYNSVVLIHGCYWHGHEDCRFFTPPKTRTEWWIKKINENRARDKKNLKKLKEQGWYPLIVWECELKPEKKQRTLESLAKMLVNK